LQFVFFFIMYFQYEKRTYFTLNFFDGFMKHFDGMFERTLTSNRVVYCGRFRIMHKIYINKFSKSVNFNPFHRTKTYLFFITFFEADLAACNPVFCSGGFYVCALLFFEKSCDLYKPDSNNSRPNLI
jgi:hypothetical protein